ncbi:hypothetical protein Tco_0130505 [Tanacetum coccineum]
MHFDGDKDGVDENARNEYDGGNMNDDGGKTMDTNDGGNEDDDGNINEKGGFGNEGGLWDKYSGNMNDKIRQKERVCRLILIQKKKLKMRT